MHLRGIYVGIVTTTIAINTYFYLHTAHTRIAHRLYIRYIPIHARDYFLCYYLFDDRGCYSISIVSRHERVYIECTSVHFRWMHIAKCTGPHTHTYSSHIVAYDKNSIYFLLVESHWRCYCCFVCAATGQSQSHDRFVSCPILPVFSSISANWNNVNHESTKNKITTNDEETLKSSVCSGKRALCAATGKCVHFTNIFFVFVPNECKSTRLPTAYRRAESIFFFTYSYLLVLKYL